MPRRRRLTIPVRFWDVFYIDATSHQTASAGLSALAKSAKAGETSDEALAWLESKQERWLLVLNNADDPQLNLQQFFPRCTHGDILITTRNQQMRVHAQDKGSFCRVDGMLPKDALELMLKVSQEEGEDVVSLSTKLVEVCCNLATIEYFYSQVILATRLLCARNHSIRRIYANYWVWAGGLLPNLPDGSSTDPEERPGPAAR